MKRIGIIGPESTGKSLLAEKLSLHFNSPWIPEYARKYIEELGKKYTFEDVVNIAKKQIEENIEYTQKFGDKAKYLFFDTELIITKVWFLDVWGKCPDFLTEALNNYDIDFFLLCQPDLPWYDDPVRENGNRRDYFYNWYKKEIISLKKPFAEINGQNGQRTKNAIKALTCFDNL